MPKKQFRTLTCFEPGEKCSFCLQNIVNEVYLGPIYKIADITVHYFCLLMASSVKQEGTDQQGILGFLLKDIREELAVGSTVVCSYCKKCGATIKCCNDRCDKIFHMPCGQARGSLHQYFDKFLSFCGEHRINQIIPREMKKLASGLCIACTCRIRYRDIKSYLWPTCCSSPGFLHRECIQIMATTAGYYFKCPLCKNEIDFQKEMRRCGIYIPEREAVWELEPNAYGDLLLRNNICEADPCHCHHGRKYTKNKSDWQIQLCDSCGGSGTHLKCCDTWNPSKGYNFKWNCSVCSPIVQTTGNNEQNASQKNITQSNEEGPLSSNENETINLNDNVCTISSTSSNPVVNCDIDSKIITNDKSDIEAQPQTRSRTRSQNKRKFGSQGHTSSSKRVKTSSELQYGNESLITTGESPLVNASNNREVGMMSQLRSILLQGRSINNRQMAQRVTSKKNEGDRKTLDDSPPLSQTNHCSSYFTNLSAQTRPSSSDKIPFDDMTLALSKDPEHIPSAEVPNSVSLSSQNNSLYPLTDKVCKVSDFIHKKSQEANISSSLYLKASPQLHHLRRTIDVDVYRPNKACSSYITNSTFLGDTKEEVRTSKSVGYMPQIMVNNFSLFPKLKSTASYCEIKKSEDCANSDISASGNNTKMPVVKEEIKKRGVLDSYLKYDKKNKQPVVTDIGIEIPRIMQKVESVKKLKQLSLLLFATKNSTKIAEVDFKNLQESDDKKDFNNNASLIKTEFQDLFHVQSTESSTLKLEQLQVNKQLKDNENTLVHSLDSYLKNGKSSVGVSLINNAAKVLSFTKSSSYEDYNTDNVLIKPVNEHSLLNRQSSIVNVSSNIHKYSVLDEDGDSLSSESSSIDSLHPVKAKNLAQSSHLDCISSHWPQLPICFFYKVRVKSDSLSHPRNPPCAGMSKSVGAPITDSYGCNSLEETADMDFSEAEETPRPNIVRKEGEIEKLTEAINLDDSGSDLIGQSVVASISSGIAASESGSAGKSDYSSAANYDQIASNQSDFIGHSMENSNVVGPDPSTSLSSNFQENRCLLIDPLRNGIPDSLYGSSCRQVVGRSIEDSELPENQTVSGFCGFDSQSKCNSKRKYEKFCHSIEDVFDHLPYNPEKCSAPLFYGRPRKTNQSTPLGNEYILQSLPLTHGDIPESQGDFVKRKRCRVTSAVVKKTLNHSIKTSPVSNFKDCRIVLKPLSAFELGHFGIPFSSASLLLNQISNPRKRHHCGTMSDGIELKRSKSHTWMQSERRQESDELNNAYEETNEDFSSSKRDCVSSEPDVLLSQEPRVKKFPFKKNLGISDLAQADPNTTNADNANKMNYKSGGVSQVLTSTMNSENQEGPEIKRIFGGTIRNEHKTILPENVLCATNAKSVNKSNIFTSEMNRNEILLVSVNNDCSGVINSQCQNEDWSSFKDDSSIKDCEKKIDGPSEIQKWKTGQNNSATESRSNPSHVWKIVDDNSDSKINNEEKMSLILGTRDEDICFSSCVNKMDVNQMVEDVSRDLDDKLNCNISVGPCNCSDVLMTESVAGDEAKEKFDLSVIIDTNNKFSEKSNILLKERKDYSPWSDACKNEPRGNDNIFNTICFTSKAQQGLDSQDLAEEEEAKSQIVKIEENPNMANKNHLNMTKRLCMITGSQKKDSSPNVKTSHKESLSEIKAITHSSCSSKSNYKIPSLNREYRKSVVRLYSNQHVWHYEIPPSGNKIADRRQYSSTNHHPCSNPVMKPFVNRRYCPCPNDFRSTLLKSSAPWHCDIDWRLNKKYRAFHKYTSMLLGKRRCFISCNLNDNYITFLLHRFLNEESVEIAPRQGFSIVEHLKKIYKQYLKGRFRSSVVFVVTSTNNFFCRENYFQHVAHFVQKMPNTRIVLSTSQYRKESNSDKINLAIQVFNGMIKKLCLKNNLACLDVNRTVLFLNFSNT